MDICRRIADQTHTFSLTLGLYFDRRLAPADGMLPNAATADPVPIVGLTRGAWGRIYHLFYCCVCFVSILSWPNR